MMRNSTDDPLDLPDTPEPGAFDDQSGWNRRRLLGGAVSGLAILAGELVLPEFDARAEASGGRRGNNRRGRDKQRNHGKRKDKHKRQDQDKPRGASGGNRNVAIHVHNYRTVPVQVQGWQFDHETGSGPQAVRTYAVPAGWAWSAIPARAADGSHSTKDFICTRDRDVTEERVVIVQIGTDRFVWCFNDPFWFPRAEIWSGSWWPAGRGQGSQLLGSVNMFVNESFSRDGIKVTRLNDTEDHIQFTVDL